MPGNCFAPRLPVVIATAVMLIACGGGGGSDAGAAPTTPPPTNVQAACTDHPYGGADRQSAIAQAMRSGSAAEVAAAIDAAKEVRGTRLGCSERERLYLTPNFTPPTLAAVTQVWRNVHEPALARFDATCPPIGREAGMAALGAVYARAAGVTPAAAVAAVPAAIGDAFVDAQYAPANAPATTFAVRGMFAYVVAPSGDRCSLAGVAGDSVVQACDRYPQLCLAYTGGRYAGRTFFVADHSLPLSFYDGGGAFDHAFAAVLMPPLAQAAATAAARDRYAAAAALAADFAAQSPPVYNHNYTAKLVWTLARRYAATGNSADRAALLDKLDRNLLPGVLLDANGDGIVDGTRAVRFADLILVAQRPGRMWDGHNSASGYQAMNTWGLVEAYVALRDRGDTASAARLRPVALAMLDNLAWEIVNRGTDGREPLQQQQVPIALLLGLWKIAAPENLARSDWERAAWALWNTGQMAARTGPETMVTGLYLLVTSGARYSPGVL